MHLALAILAILVGFIALVKGADLFVDGSAALARNLGVPPLIIGLTIVGFGTSAPEMLVSAMAAAAGNSGLAIGNAIGSNITNVNLVLGASAIVSPLAVHSKILRRELPVLLITMGVAWVMMLDGRFSRIDGAILLAGLIFMIGFVVREGIASAKAGGDAQGEAGEGGSAAAEDDLPDPMSNGKSIAYLLGGLFMLVASSRLVVWGAVKVAVFFGVSQLVIGLTVVAIGTSLPEMAASVMSAAKNEHDLAIGNVIGSNMFNLLGVLAIPGLLQPGGFEARVLHRDMPIMVGSTVMLFFMARGFRNKAQVSRAEGAVLVVVYLAYVASVCFEALAS